MSRKTSSIVNRLNITYFWDFKKYSINYSNFLKFINYFKLINSFLFLKNLDLIYYFVNKSSIKLFQISLIIYFFDLIKFSLKYKNAKRILFQFKLIYFKNYFQLFSFNLVSNLIFLQKLFLNFNLKIILSFNLKYLKFFIFFFKFFRLFYLRLYLYKSILINAKFFWLAKRAEFLLFKMDSLLIKNIEFDLKTHLSRFSNLEVEVNIINIFKIMKKFNFKLHLSFFQFYKYNSLSYFWNFINVFYLGILFNKIDLIVKIIAKEVSRKKTLQKRYLYSIIKILSQIYRQKILPIKGLRLVISGKIDCKIRKKKISYTKGSLGFQSFNQKLLYNLIHYDTKFGVISIKFWLTKF